MKVNTYNNNWRKHYIYILFRRRFSNRKSNTLHNNYIKVNCQLFFFTQFVRLYFVLPCTLSLTIFVQPQVFQLVPQQPLTQVVRLFFTVQLPVIQLLFSLLLFHPLSLSSYSRIFRSSLIFFNSVSLPFLQKEANEPQPPVLPHLLCVS